MTPEELKQSSKDVKPVSRRGFLKLAGVTIAGIFTGTIFRSKESTEATSPPTVIHWIDSLERQRDTGFFNASSGIPPYNNPYRPVATIYDWINTPDNNFTTPPTLIYQPWEGLYEETQAGPGVDLTVGGLLADGTTNKQYMLTSVMTSQDGRLVKFSIEVIQDANNPLDYSNNGRKRVNDVLSQQGFYRNVVVSAYQFGTDTSNRKYIEISFYNEYVPAEKGTERSYLDSNGNPLPFTIVPTVDPSPTKTATPPQPTPTATPTVVFRTFNLYLPIAGKDFQHKQ